MLNIYEQITRNKRRSFLIVSLFVAFILSAAFLINRYLGTNNSIFVFAIIFLLASSLISYFHGPKIVLALNHAQPASRQQFFNFYTVTENLSLANQIPMPKIYVIDSPAPNAFATGRNPQQAIVCATTGLLSKLNRSQLEAVVAHELSHIKNYDTLLMTMVSILIGSLTLLIRTSFYTPRRQRKNSSDLLALLGMALIILAPLIAKLLQLAISRHREFLADASAVKLTRQPQSLISALQKISQDPNLLHTASTATAPLYIHNPFKNNPIANLFSTQPPIEARIAALQQML